MYSDNTKAYRKYFIIFYIYKKIDRKFATLKKTSYEKFKPDIVERKYTTERRVNSTVQMSLVSMPIRKIDLLLELKVFSTHRQSEKGRYGK